MPSISEICRTPRGRALLLGFLTLLILAPLSFLTFGQLLEHYALDFLYARRAPQPPPPQLLIVGIDEPSFQEFGLAWPWPRKLHASLIDRLAAAGARVIVFDVVFADPSPKSDDADFAAAISRAGNVVLAEELDTTNDPHFSREILVQPYKLLRQAARGSGVAAVTPDPDGVVRHFHLQVHGLKPLVAVATQTGSNGPSSIRELKSWPPGLIQSQNLPAWSANQRVRLWFAARSSLERCHQRRSRDRRLSVRQQFRHSGYG